jgi:hypothetical protein
VVGLLPGFHADIYYAELQPPPPGAHFSSEWGFTSQLQGTTGDSREYPHEAVMDAIRQGAGSPDLSDVRLASEQACAA